MKREVAELRDKNNQKSHYCGTLNDLETTKQR